MTFSRPRAVRRNSFFIVALLIVLMALVAWAIKHVYAISYALSDNSSPNLELIFLLSFFFLAWSTIISAFDIPKKVSRQQQAELNKLHVAAIIPCYNEDGQMLQACISSLVNQSRKPNHIYMVDDGSTEDSYKDIKRWAQAYVKKAGIKFTWKRTDNRGKRHAQSVGVRATPKADIYLTVDSDGILDREAIKEGLKPFADKRVKSVAGVVMALNNQKNLLTRFTDLWFVVGQLLDRSSYSAMGSVLVNSGVLAFYDAPMIRKNLDAYLNESFFGVPVEFSDDSMLTLYALQEGRAVQQTTSFAFTIMPENLNHHLRQYIRWMRGAFIRSWWRFKYLPLDNYAYWSHLIGWMQVIVSTVVFISLFFVDPIIARSISPYILFILIAVGYGQSLRYLTIKRSDETLLSQLYTFSLGIVSTLWASFVLRVVRWYSIATCRRTGWNTRKTVEVGLA